MKKKTNNINKNGQIAIFAFLFIALIIGSYFGGHAIGWWGFAIDPGEEPYIPYNPPPYEPFDPDPIVEDPPIPVIPDDPPEEDPYIPPPYVPFDPDPIVEDGEEEEEIPDEKEPINFAYVAIAFVIVGAIIVKVRMTKK